MQKIKIPTAQELKDSQTPAAIAFMIYRFLRSCPDAELSKNNGRSEEDVVFFNSLMTNLFKIKDIDGFYELREQLFKSHLIGLEDTSEKNVEKIFSIATGEHLDVYHKATAALGLNTQNWLSEKFIESVYNEARVATGENHNKIAAETIEEETTEEQKKRWSEKERKDYEQMRRTEKLIHHESPESWHLIKQMSRSLVKEQKASPEEWADFERKEIEFTHRFGLKGLRFPYAMTLKDRSEGLDEMTTNFEKISKALDMPDSFIGFKERLPLFYGGAIEGSLGTYSPITHTLFILKDMGDRATAHEWFHALDYELARQATTNATRAIKGNSISFSEPRRLATFGKLKECQSAMVDLMEGVNRGFSKDPIINAEEYTRPGGMFWKTLQQVYAKEVFKHIPPENKENALVRFNTFCKKFHNNEIKADEFTAYIKDEYSNGLSLTNPKSKETLLTAFEAEINVMSKLYQSLKEDPDLLKNERTSFFNWFCEQLDDHNDRRYYTIPTEMIARMGEQFVFDKLGVSIQEYKTPQYVLDFEKEKIQSHFSDWVASAKEFLDIDRDLKMTQKIKTRP